MDRTIIGGCCSSARRPPPRCPSSYWALGAFVFFKHPRNAAGRLLFLFGAGWFCQLAAEVVNMDGAERFFASPHAPSPLLAGLLWSALFLPLLPLTLLVFPSPKWPVRTQPRLTVAALLATPIAAFGAALWRTGSVSAGVAAAAPVRPAMFTIIPASMAHTLLTARGPAQAQSRWVAWGASRSPEVTSPGAG